MVCGQPLLFKIDTGADATAISEEDYRKIKGKGKLANCEADQTNRYL